MRELVSTLLEVLALLVLAAGAGLGAVRDPSWPGLVAGGGALLVGSVVVQVSGRGER